MVFSFNGVAPRLGEGVFIAPGATVLGDVEIGRSSSVWFGSVVRGDSHWIRIGEDTNIQDGAVLHVTTGLFPLSIGSSVTIGHRAVVHGCNVGDRVLIGMGALVLDGAVIGEESVVAAGALVPEGAVFPPRSLIMGVPGKVVRPVADAEVFRILESCRIYRAAAADYLAGRCVDITGDCA